LLNSCDPKKRQLVPESKFSKQKEKKKQKIVILSGKAASQPTFEFSFGGK